MSWRTLLATVALAGACRPHERISTVMRAPNAVVVDADRSTSGTLHPLRIAAPPDGWWEAAAPCPVGTVLSVFEGGEDLFDVPSIDCRRTDGTKHGPSTTFARNRERIKAGHYRNGLQHGEWQEFLGARTPEDVDVAFYDEGVGIGTWRSSNGKSTRTLEHRSAREVYRTVRRDRRVVEEGLLVDGRRQGSWTIEAGGNVRTVTFVDGRAGGTASISGVPECDAFADRWSRCLELKDGAERYDMAWSLDILIGTWEKVPTLPGTDEPLCLTHVRNHDERLREHSCPD